MIARVIRTPAAVLLLLLVTAAAGGCGQIEGPPAGFGECAPGDAAPAVPTAPDYWHDAKPILDAKCASAGCHVPGGIAPFPLTSYAETLAQPGIAAALTSGVMPPWPPGDCCQEYAHARSLTPTEKGTLLRWLETGAPAGDPAGAPPSQPPPLPRLSRVDLTLRMPEPYVPVPQEGTSELRCFVLDGWPYEGEMFVTGVDVRPSNRAIVHHVIAQIVDAGAVPGLKAREGRDGRPGFACRDVQGELHVNGSAGGWTPGTTPVESPDGKIGVRFAAHSQILLQIHYDVHGGAAAPDQTEIDFQVADHVEHQGKGLIVTNPLWLAGDALEIEAGDPDAVHTFAYDPTVIFGKGRSMFIHSVALHMHYLGSRGRVAIHRENGDWDCLIDVKQWDYHWSSQYQLAQPVEVRPGDLLYVECHWDNTADNQAPIQGVVPPPRDLHWGSSQEMCAGILLWTETWP